MTVNEYVEDGTVKHRRVNDPKTAGRPRTERDVIHTRSVSLASESLGLSGKLDLVEEKGQAMYPVEYKRSAAPTDERGQATYWENDALQLCAQGLLLEEHLGRPVPSAVLYYIGSKARVRVPLDADLRQKTHDAIARIRAIAAAEHAPPPFPQSLPIVAMAVRSSLSVSLKRRAFCEQVEKLLLRSRVHDHFARLAGVG